jgi:quaternary ammonium compound-resistance protein SugE
MAWFSLIVAGLLEVAWAIGLKYTQGFTKPLPSVLTAAAIVASMWLLSTAAKTLPIGTAYAIWVGIGATGAAVLGVVLLGETMSLARGACLVVMVASLVGLKLTT